jgi:predicted DCC family thiol-disulfide oxidoreductase YuxK
MIPDEPADSATLLYDADCGFCKWALSLFLRWDRVGRLRPVALQRPEAVGLLPELSPEERLASWHLVSATGEVRSGGAAFPVLLGMLPGGRLPALAVEQLPSATDRAYGWIAGHRAALSRFVPARAKARAGRVVDEREHVPAPLS